MARREIQLNISLIDRKSPHLLDIRVVDRSALNEADLDFILGSLPPVSMARVDSESYRPFLGIDMFYDITASLKGLVFVYGSRGLVVRVPDGVEKTSAKVYEREQAAARRSPPAPKGKIKGRPQQPPSLNHRASPYQCMRKLLQSDLAGFGMSQISLTIWYYLRERVAGVNLSTATSKSVPPPKRFSSEPNEEDVNGKSVPNSKQQHARSDGGKGGRGRSRGERDSRGGTSHGLGRVSSGDQNGEDDAQTKAPAIFPDDEPLNWDRVILSPGDVLKKVYPDVSVTEVDTAFIGNDTIMDMEARVAEAASRAWVSYLAAHELNTAVQNAPLVQPSRLNDKELIFFAESMVTKWKVLGETSPMRKLQLEHYNAENGKLTSTKYETKIRGGEHQYITWFDGEEEKRIYLQSLSGKPKEVGLTEVEGERPEPPSRPQAIGEDRSFRGYGRGRGRRGHRQRYQGQVREYGEETSELQGAGDAHNESEPKKTPIRLPKDIEMWVYGRDDATRTDEQRDLFILRLLEGRGSLHGPKYKDCGFIRRVWFPTYDQKSIGEQRKKEKAAAVRGKHDWMDDDWGDDTDEEEVARIQALKLADGDSDHGDETEGEDVGQSEPTLGLSLPKSIRLNPSQRGVVGRVVAPNPRGRTRATLVHGPPGTGKTSTIAAAVWIFAQIGQPAWIVAQSNVGIKNVAQKLVEVGFNDFTLLVSQDYLAYWQDRYNVVKGRFFTTARLREAKFQQQLFSSKAVLCTLATLSSGYLEKFNVFVKMPLQHLIIDEASQIDMTSEFMHIFYRHRSTLKSVCWFGDPKQLPPYGWSEGTEIQDIFKVEHLLANSRLLDTSYRLPIPIAKYISRAVYRSELKPHMGHDIRSPRDAIVFVDVADGEEEGGQGSGIGGTGASWRNTTEAEVTTKIIQTYYERSVVDDSGYEERLEYAVITPYDGQRILVGEMFEEAGIQQQVYNVDSFQASIYILASPCHIDGCAQGNEADYIITSIAKTGGPGFLNSINRLNVLLTRCKRGLVVVTRRDFVQRAGGLLLGLLYSVEPYDPWVNAEDVVQGYVDLPGSPAPNTRPPPEVDSPAPESRNSLPPRPSGRPPPPSIVEAMQQVAASPEASNHSEEPQRPYTYGMNRVKSNSVGNV